MGLYDGVYSAPVSGLSNAQRPSLVPNRRALTQAEIDANHSAALGPFVGGLRSGVSGMKGSVASLYGTGAEVLGADDAAQDAHRYAQEQRELAAVEGGSIPTWEDTGVSNFGDFVAGNTGRVLPQILPTTAAILTTRGLGGGRAAQFAAGTGVSFPQVAGEQAGRLKEDPTTAAMPALDRFGNSTVVGGISAIGETLVPYGLTRGLRPLISQAPAASVAARAGRAARDIVGASALEGGIEGAQTYTGQAGHTFMNPDRDKSGDTKEITEAIASGAFGTAPIIAPPVLAQHAVAGVEEVAGRAAGATRDALGGVPGAVRDAAGTLRDAAGNTVDAAGNIVVPSAEQVGQAAGRAVRGVKNAAANLSDLVTGRDVVGEYLRTEQRTRTGAPDTAALQGDDELRNTAATKVAEDIINSGDASPEHQQAATDYLAGPRSGNAWQPVQEASRQREAGRGFVDHAQDFVEWAEPIVIKAGKAASDFKAGFKKENAQTPAGDKFDALFVMAIKRQLRPDEAASTDYPGDAQNRLNDVAQGMQAWIKNGFAAQAGGAVTAPPGLYDLFQDPATAVEAAYGLMKQQALVSGELEGSMKQAVRMLTDHKEAAKSLGAVVAAKILPTVQADSNYSTNDHRSIAQRIVRMIEHGDINDPALDDMFGGNKNDVLDELEKHAQRSIGEHQQVGARQLSSDDDNMDDAESADAMQRDDSDDVATAARDEELGGMTSAIKPNEEFGKVEYHYYNQRAETAYDLSDDNHIAHAKKKMDEAKGVGYASVRSQGVVDAARERYADDVAGRAAAMEQLADRYPGKTLDEINKGHFVLRYERADDKRDPLNIPGEEFASVTPQSAADKKAGKKSSNRWAIDPGRDNVHGASSKGTVWLERVGEEGDVKPFATTVNKLVKHAREAKKAGALEGSDDSLLDQAHMLVAALSSVINSKTASGRHALTGRVGFMKAGEDIKWHGTAYAPQDMEEDVRPRAERMATAEEEGAGMRAASEVRAGTLGDIFSALPNDLLLPSGHTLKEARGITSRQERAKKQERVQLEPGEDGKMREVMPAAASEKFDKADLPGMTYDEITDVLALAEERIRQMRLDAPKAMRLQLREMVPAHKKMIAGEAREEAAAAITKLHRKLYAIEKSPEKDKQAKRDIITALETRVELIEAEIAGRKDLNRGVEGRRIEGTATKTDRLTSSEFAPISAKDRATRKAELSDVGTPIGKEYAQHKGTLGDIKAERAKLTAAIGRANELVDAGQTKAIKAERSVTLDKLFTRLKALDEREGLVEAQMKALRLEGTAASSSTKRESWRTASVPETEEMAEAATTSADRKEHKYEDAFPGEEVTPKQKASVIAAAKDPDVQARGAAMAATQKQIDWVKTELRKGVSAFVAAVSKLSPERQAGVRAMLRAMTSEAQMRQTFGDGPQAKEISTINNRAVKALAAMNGGEPTQKTDPSPAETDATGFYDKIPRDLSIVIEKTTGGKTARKTVNARKAFMAANRNAEKYEALKGCMT